MGIPRLSARLRSYATTKVVGRSGSTVSHSVAIIDGPGLAHYIYYRILDDPDATLADVTYAVCVEATVQWLDALRSFGFVVYVEQF